MTRRSTVNRTTRPARRKEAKSIEDARELIMAMVPNGFRIYLSAHFHDHRENGRAYSSSGLSCSVYNTAGVEVVDVKSPTPAGIVAAVLRKLQEPPQRTAPPYDGGVLSRELTVAASSSNEPRSSTPRIAPRVLPRLTNGE